jgi:hypothetical protein
MKTNVLFFRSVVLGKIIRSLAEKIDHECSEIPNNLWSKNQCYRLNP